MSQAHAMERIDRYEQIHARSLRDPDAFWGEAAEALRWSRKWDVVLDESKAPFYRWFTGGELNTCDNAIDLHVDEGRGDQAALIYDSPVAGAERTYTYRELRDETARFAGALAALGVIKGDRVVIYMAMVPETVIAMLACARLGAVHSVVFGGFAAHELAVRIDDCMPKVIVAGSCGIERDRIVHYKPLLDEAIETARHKPERCIILQRDMATCELTPGRDISWNDAMADATPHGCVPCAATDPLYILYTSGTTGRPKGVVRDHGGHAVALKWSMSNVYGVAPGEVFWAASDLGWVVGHSYIVYGPLLNGSTTVLYEGKPIGTPDAGAFGRVISEHRVKCLFTAPTAFRAIKREDPAATMMSRYDLSPLHSLFLAGERADPETLRWAEERLGVPVIDHWWQTETGWAIAANCIGLGLLPIKYGSVAKPAPGWDLHVLDPDGTETPAGTIGALAARLPMPPGSLPTLWHSDEQFIDSYLNAFPGYYETGDAGYIDEDGYVFVMARTDDIINVAGHRLSTGGMEEVLAGHPDVAECAVVGVADAVKGQVPLGFVVLESGVGREHGTIVAELIHRIRDQLGPVASFKQALVVDQLPKTRSGKILRSTMRMIADSEDFRIPATIDDPGVLDEVRQALREIGYARLL